MTRLSEIFDGVTMIPTINEGAFKLLQDLCATDGGIKDFLASRSKSKIMTILVALANHKNTAYRALAVQILSTPLAVYGLARRGEDKSDQIMTLLEYKFTAKQTAQILSKSGAVLGLAFHGQANRLMNLLEEDIFTPQQKISILKAENTIYALSHSFLDQAKQVKSLMASLNMLPTHPPSSTLDVTSQALV